MDPNEVIDFVLPLTLAMLAFSLGLGLRLVDFTNVGRAPRGFLAGAAAQVVFLPLLAFLIVKGFGVEGTTALGIMILAVCPGGVTSNVIVRLAQGNVALSVSLTAVINLVSILTAPLLVTLWVGIFLPDILSPTFKTTDLTLTLFMLTGLPIVIGMSTRAALPALAQHLEPIVLRLGVAVFVACIVALGVVNLDPMLASLKAIGVVLIALALTMAATGWSVATLSRVASDDRVAITIEAAIQNAPMGVTLAVILESATGLDGIAAPSALYALVMYPTILPVLLVARRAAAH